jgi:hypothetical protein
LKKDVSSLSNEKFSEDNKLSFSNFPSSIYNYFKNIISQNQKLASEDFHTIQKKLLESYETRQNSLGIFQNSFIKEAASKRNMTETYYIEKILPLINTLINEYQIIEDGEQIIQGMSLKVWRLKNDTDVLIK